MKIKWQTQKDDIPGVSQIIDKGLDKLEEYRARADMVPAYILAMGEDTSMSILSYDWWWLVINPHYKLRWFHEHVPKKVDDVKELFIETVLLIIVVLHADNK
jgi:hypothetical protein